MAAPGASAQDNTPPEPASAEVYFETVLRLYTNEALDQTSLPHPSAFTVKIDGGTARPAPEVGFCGQNCIALAVHFLLDVDVGKTVTVSYTKPATNPLQDSAGNETLSFTDFSVGNSLTSFIAKPLIAGSVGRFRSAKITWQMAAVGTVTKYQVGYYLSSRLELVWEDVAGGAAARTTPRPVWSPAGSMQSRYGPWAPTASVGLVKKLWRRCTARTWRHRAVSRRRGASAAGPVVDGGGLDRGGETGISTG